jgi:sialate O-acetylesterase
MAVAIDVGDAQDIHPQDKRSVGERLAQWALVRHFGKPGVASGPLYAGMTIEGNRIRIRFEIIGRGLVAKRGKAVSHVVIAGTGRRFVPAKAVIEGGTLVVESPEIEFPVAVRYAWADNPEGCNLYNRDGLPASPFRTDNW